MLRYWLSPPPPEPPAFALPPAQPALSPHAGTGQAARRSRHNLETYEVRSLSARHTPDNGSRLSYLPGLLGFECLLNHSINDGQVAGQFLREGVAISQVGDA